MLRLRDKIWETGSKTYVMGIINLTPDSFSDAGRLFDARIAVEAACEMVHLGADIVDIGGQSTRPGSVPINEAEELSRVAEVAEALGEKGIPFSVDTFFASVAEYCLKKGALMINDVSGRVQTDMAQVVREYGAAWVVMHNRDITSEADCVNTVRDELRVLAETACTLGVERERICLDPGIGFGKTNSQSIELLKSVSSVKPEGYTFLTAASRKRCIGEMSGVAVPQERDAATAVAHSAAIAGGTDIIRVHNVKLAVEAARVADSLFRR